MIYLVILNLSSASRHFNTKSTGVDRNIIFDLGSTEGKREIEARKWRHTDTALLIVCAPTWERGGGHQLPRYRITGPKCF